MDVFVVVRSFITHEPIHDQPLLFVGILLVIFGFQFVLIGLLAEMIRHYAFQPNEEYSIRQELERCSGSNGYNGFVPAKVHEQQGTLQARGEPLYSQSPPEWGQQQLQPLWDKRNGSEHDNRSRYIPHRPTMIPL